MQSKSTATVDVSRSAGTDGAWLCRDRILSLYDQPLIMGVVNVTPDSFSDGGDYVDVDAAVAHALDMIDQGADIIDIGGESTRPGAQPVDAVEQMRRTIPVVRQLCSAADIAISIDTRLATVARGALDAGAHIVNDVSALRDDAQMLPLVRDSGAGLVLMHMQGDPLTMQTAPSYDDVVAEVCDFLKQRSAIAMDAGIDAARIVVDPGIGFGKTLQHNLALLSHLDRLAVGNRPLLVGFSRKRFLGDIVGDLQPKERLFAGLAVTALAVWQGVSVIRTHDVAATRDAVDVARAVRRERKA